MNLENQSSKQQGEDKTKELEEQITEIINLAIYKDRKRVTPSARGGYNGYYDY